MKKSYIVLIFVVMTGLVGVYTNPNLKQHREAVKEKINTYLQKSLKENTSEIDNILGGMAQSFGMMLGGAVVDGLVSNAIKTENYVIFSVTKLSWEGKSHRIGIGIFGNVFLSKKIDKELEKGLLNR